MSNKKKIKIGLLTAAALFITGCANAADHSMQKSEFLAMDTYISLSASGSSSKAALDLCRKEIEALDSSLSVTNPGSEIYRINQGAENGFVLSAETKEIISAALEIGTKTKGALDITLYPVTREWGFTTGEYKIPSEETLQRLLKNTGFEKAELSDNTLTLPAGFQIDLGSVAKGYAGDRAKEILKEQGVSSALINLGGNVCAVGTKPDGSPWRIGVQNPWGEGYACIINAADKHIVTSGSYQRYFERDGKRYCHIIDPDTGCPADNGLASVTVIGDSGIICDGLSTALFVMGRDKAVEFWREQGGFEMIIITEDEKVMATEGIFESCKEGEMGAVEAIPKN